MPNIAESRQSEIRFVRIVIGNLIVVSIIVGIVVGNVLPASAVAPIAFLGMLIANYVIIRRTTRTWISIPEKYRRINKLVWIGVFVFNTSGIAMVVGMIRKPDIRSIAQALIGILLAGYTWFLVYRVSKNQNEQF